MKEVAGWALGADKIPGSRLSCRPRLNLTPLEFLTIPQSSPMHAFCYLTCLPLLEASRTKALLYTTVGEESHSLTCRCRILSGRQVDVHSKTARCHCTDMSMNTLRFATNH